MNLIEPIDIETMNYHYDLSFDQRFISQHNGHLNSKLHN